MRAHFAEIANQHHSAAKHSLLSAACESIWVAYCYNLDYEAAQRKLVKCGMCSPTKRSREDIADVGLLFLVMACLEYPGIFQKYKYLYTYLYFKNLPNSFLGSKASHFSSPIFIEIFMIDDFDGHRIIKL